MMDIQHINSDQLKEATYSTMGVLAQFSLPKQRMTRPYRIVLTNNEEFGNPYQVHRQYLDRGDKDTGSYLNTFEEAYQEFIRRVQQELERYPTTGAFEIAS